MNEMGLGQKWKSRRRLFTPAFHFKVLDNFVQTFNEHSVVFCRKLQEICKKTQVIDVYPLLNSCALDIVCGKQRFE
jgi:cytochrome P450